MSPTEANSAPAASGTAIVRLIGLAGALTSVLLSPPVFSSRFAMSFLLRRETTLLWLASGVLLATSIYIAIHRSPKRLDRAALFFACLLLSGAELAARFYVVHWNPVARERLARLAHRTYPELMAYQGHPFLQFTGTPSRQVVDDRVLGDLAAFNNFGFLGADFELAKPPGVVRVAALGGSTTASGYPAVMERILNAESATAGEWFEVMNFGQGWYSSAHSLVNFVLNVVEFSPDYVVIHHAWNDKSVRDAGGHFRSDYSHALRHFRDPVIPDRMLIRASIWYRFVKHRLTREPEWAFLDHATVTDLGRRKNKIWDDVSELRIYRRNLATILDLARIRGIEVVLTTQPHSLNPEAGDAHVAPHIRQCNTIVRELAEAYPEAILVDLDRMMTGEMEEVFLDLAHVDGDGRRFKAEAIARVILGDRPAASDRVAQDATVTLRGPSTARVIPQSRRHHDFDVDPN